MIDYIKLIIKNFIENENKSKLKSFNNKLIELIIKTIKLTLQSFDNNDSNRDIKWLISKDHFKGENKENCPFLNLRKENLIVGNDRDDHGCIPSAGYVWCEKKQKCIRPWEENK